MVLVWENRSDGGLAIPIRDLPQHNISEAVTVPLHTQYMSGMFLFSDWQLKAELYRVTIRLCNKLIQDMFLSSVNRIFFVELYIPRISLMHSIILDFLVICVVALILISMCALTQRVSSIN